MGTLYYCVARTDGEAGTMTDAITVASYVNSRVSIPSFDTKKLQKLLYFSQAWHMAWTGKKLFAEPFEAWPDGPVVRRVWGYQNNEGVPPYSGAGLSDEQRAVIDSVLRHYSNLSFQELVDLSHAHQPWIEARAGLEPSATSRNQLKDSTIVAFYTRLAIADPEAPRRESDVHFASFEDVREAGRQSSMVWREALDLLATR